MWALHAGFLALEVSPVVPTGVLAEAWRGGSRQANIARLLALCTVEAFDESLARAVGELAGRARHDDVVDVAVVEGAVRRQDVVVTSDPTHITAIASAVRRRIRVETV